MNFLLDLEHFNLLRYFKMAVAGGGTIVPIFGIQEKDSISPRPEFVAQLSEQLLPAPVVPSSNHKSSLIII